MVGCEVQSITGMEGITWHYFFVDIKKNICKTIITRNNIYFFRPMGSWYYPNCVRDYVDVKPMSQDWKLFSTHVSDWISVLGNNVSGFKTFQLNDVLTSWETVTELSRLLPEWHNICHLSRYDSITFKVNVCLSDIVCWLLRNIMMTIIGKV